MTREEIKESLPIVQAWAEGKTIQCNFGDGWIDADIDLDLSLGDISKFRIKPEPKYRPFNSMEECWQEIQKHNPYGWLKSKECGCFKLIGEVAWIDAQKEVAFTFSTQEKEFCNQHDLFNKYTFLDGTPFGIKEE